MKSILQWLRSEETGRPFQKCNGCGFPLLEIGEPWLVNKEYHRGECVVEYAICVPCRERVSSQFCDESKKAIRNFIENEIDWETRLREFMMFETQVERFNHCISCRTPSHDLEGYGISALFDSEGYLTSGPLPLLICKGCTSRMTASLSEDSREVWRQFCSEFHGTTSDDNDLGIF